MISLYNVSARLFRHNEEIEVLKPAISMDAAVKKVVRAIKAGKVFTTVERVIPEHMRDGVKVAAEVVTVRNPVSGTIDSLEAGMVHHTAFHRSRWNEKIGKFVMRCPTPYYHGRRLAQTSAQGDTPFVRNRLADYIERQNERALSVREWLPVAEPVALPSEVKTTDAKIHAAEDFSPRKKLDTQLKNRKKNDNSDQYEREYREEWAMQAENHQNKPKKAKKAKVTA